MSVCVCEEPVFLSVPALAGRNPVPSSLPLHLESLIGVQAEGGELAGAVTMRGAGGQQRGLSENKVCMGLLVRICQVSYLEYE